MQETSKLSGEKTKTWSIQIVAVSARRTYNTAVNTRFIHAQSVYRRTPVSAGNTFQDVPPSHEEQITPNTMYNLTYIVFIDKLRLYSVAVNILPANYGFIGMQILHRVPYVLNNRKREVNGLYSHCVLSWFNIMIDRQRADEVHSQQ